MDLKDVIYDYLKNKFINYAILIKGEWGSGKTFFVKKNVVKRYDNALYISLYGISSIDKLSEKIYLEIIKSKATTNCISKFFRKLHKNIFLSIYFRKPLTMTSSASSSVSPKVMSFRSWSLFMRPIAASWTICASASLAVISGMERIFALSMIIESHWTWARHSVLPTALG